MVDAKPSYVLKMDRAEQHLAELSEAIRLYTDARPYTVRSGTEGDHKVHRLVFTKQPDPMIGIIVSDLVHNLRSGLDQVMAALVPEGQRRSVYFPIYFQGVWERAEPGEHKKWVEQRRRWRTDTRDIPPDAVAILQGAQPDKSDWDHPAETHSLIAINRLSNADKHAQLPVVPYGLLNPSSEYRGNDGFRYTARGIGERESLPDGAPFIGLPYDARDVEIEGTPKVFVHIKEVDGNLPIPDFFVSTVRATRATIEALHSHVRT